MSRAASECKKAGLRQLDDFMSESRVKSIFLPSFPSSWKALGGTNQTARRASRSRMENKVRGARQEQPQDLLSSETAGGFAAHQQGQPAVHMGSRSHQREKSTESNEGIALPAGRAGTAEGCRSPSQCRRWDESSTVLLGAWAEQGEQGAGRRELSTAPLAAAHSSQRQHSQGYCLCVLVDAPLISRGLLSLPGLTCYWPSLSPHITSDAR